MRVTYSPADGPPQVWTFRPDDVPSSMAELIENRAGCGYEEWKQSINVGKARALRVLLWHLMCRTHGVLKFEDLVDFRMGELTIDRDLEELAEVRERLELMKFDDPEVREAAFSQLDAQIDAEKARVEAGEVDSGKAPSPDFDAATPSPLQPIST